MNDFVSNAKDRLDQLEARLLLAGLLIAASLWAFIELSSGITNAESDFATDVAIMEWFRVPGALDQLRGPEGLADVASKLTTLGSITLLALVSLVMVGYLLVSRSWREALFVAIAAGGGGIFNELLKNLYSRPRPDVVPYLGHLPSSWSYPSGHSMGAATIYLALGAIAASLAPHRSQKIYIFAVAIALTITVGLTRVVLGVHYPSDVLAGWCAGWCWALLCWVVHEWMKDRVLDPEAA